MMSPEHIWPQNPIFQEYPGGLALYRLLGYPELLVYNTQPSRTGNTLGSNHSFPLALSFPMPTRWDGDSDSWTKRKRLKVLRTRAEAIDLVGVEGMWGGGGAGVLGAQLLGSRWQKGHSDKQPCGNMICCFLFNCKGLFWMLLRRRGPEHSEGKILGLWEDNFLLSRPHVPAQSGGGVGGVGCTPEASVPWVRRRMLDSWRISRKTSCSEKNNATTGKGSGACLWDGNNGPEQEVFRG